MTAAPSSAVRRYRMPKETFTSLCGSLAGPMAEMYGLLGHRIPHDVSVEVQVSVSIRWLAGGSYLDVVDTCMAASATRRNNRVVTVLGTMTPNLR